MKKKNNWNVRIVIEKKKSHTNRKAINNFIGFWLARFFFFAPLTPCHGFSSFFSSSSISCERQRRKKKGVYVTRSKSFRPHIHTQWENSSYFPSRFRLSFFFFWREKHTQEKMKLEINWKSWNLLFLRLQFNIFSLLPILWLRTFFLLFLHHLHLPHSPSKIIMIGYKKINTFVASHGVC